MHIDPLQVVGQSYSVLFNQMANASHNPQRAEARLFAAATNLDALGEQEIRLQLVAAPETHVRIQFFPIHMPVDGQLARVAWGGIVLDVTAEWNETERWNEDLTVLTRGLRSTIANLKGAVTMLLSGHRYWEQSERQTFLESIDEHVDQLNRLLDNAQEMFKLDADTIELERRDTALERLIQRVTQSLVYQKSGHQFVLDIPGDLPNLEIDPLRVEQVFANLLDNAVLFSSREKTVHIKAFQADEEIQVSMTDQSAGMSVEDVNRILEGSLQINTSSAEASRGAEIGLYVARGLILAHGGSIWAESISQTGVITHFTLPIKARASSTGTAGTQRHITTLTPPPSTNGLEIRPNRE
ncbi:MAG: hypothetical protein JXQ72_13770, partial [Anaerolineae bacterium]|nr:hypothetical protein [Anaerolineae bacterium]